MAERRMFTQKITESDAFLDMPSSSQALYFHLCMNADDDGFVSKPKSIMRSVGAKEDDIKLLSVKKFIIPFENGVIVIKHWRMHNLLRKDRYTETAYKELKDTLYIDENGSYSQTEQNVLIEDKKTLTPARQKRLEARKNSDLPYSFDYKIRNAFIGEICPICGVCMGVPIRSEDDPVISTTPFPTIQHNIPISKGGTHTLDNISVICQSCNYSIQDHETGKLNNDLVIKKWSEIGNGSGMATQNSIDKVSIELDKSNIVSKKESNKEINNKVEDTHTHERMSYDEIFESFGVSQTLKNALVGFIRHCLMNKVQTTNEKLEGIIVKLDMAHGTDEVAKVKSIQNAISGGYVDIIENKECGNE